MNVIEKVGKKLAIFGVAAFCFGYFASYIPYSMLTKMITSGFLPGLNGNRFSGFEIQPVVITGTFVAMYLFLTLSGWWRYATHSTIFGISFPRPQWFTFISGLCTSGVIITTTLAYTFQGISIVFAMLLMRGGVLVIAPIIDTIAIKRKRKIYWPSWVAALLSFGALFVTLAGKTSTAMTYVATIDISLYLLSYFVRLFFMSTWAKSSDPDEKKRFFTEEQMVANPALWVGVMITGLIGFGMDPQSIPGQLWSGIWEFPFKGYFWTAFFIGVFSYGTGLFGTLIFLDKRENTFTVPANRVSSVLAGVIATYLLAIFYGSKYPPFTELIGVTIIIFAILFLAYRTVVEKRNKVTQGAATPHEKEEFAAASLLQPSTETN